MLNKVNVSKALLHVTLSPRQISMGMSRLYMFLSLKVKVSQLKYVSACILISIKECRNYSFIDNSKLDEGWDPSIWFSSASFSCLSHPRTWTSYVVVFFMLNEFRWEVIVRVVDIGEIVYHHRVSFLFIQKVHNILKYVFGLTQKYTRKQV